MQNNVVLMNNHAVTLSKIVISSARKTSGQSVPFFSGQQQSLLFGGAYSQHAPLMQQRAASPACACVRRICCAACACLQMHTPQCQTATCGMEKLGCVIPGLAAAVIVAAQLCERPRLALLHTVILCVTLSVTHHTQWLSCAPHTRTCPSPGEGVLLMEDVVRVRLACSSVMNATINTLRTTPRPASMPGQQSVKLIDYTHRGHMYPDSVHAVDVAVFVSPGDVEDAAYYAGYSVVQRNVTRICESYVPASCNEQCLQQTVDSILAAQAGSAAAGRSSGSVLAIVVPAVVVPAGAWRRMCAAAAVCLVTITIWLMKSCSWPAPAWTA